MCAYAEREINLQIATGLRLFSQGNYERALCIFRTAFERKKQLLGPNNLATFHVQELIGRTLSHLGNLQEALNVYEDLFQKQQNILGVNARVTLGTRSKIASVILAQGKEREALDILRELYQKFKDLLGPNGLDTLRVQFQLGLALDKLGYYDEALNINRTIFEKFNETLGPYDSATVCAQHNIAKELSHLGKHDESVKVFKKVFAKQKMTLGIENVVTMRTLFNITEMLFVQSKYGDALKGFQEVLNFQNKALPKNHPDILTTRLEIANVLSAQGKWTSALEVYEELVDQTKAAFGHDHPMNVVLLGNMNLIRHKLYDKKASGVLQHSQDNNNIAASKGDIKSVLHFLKDGVNINDKDNRGRTPLHYSVSNGHRELVRALINNGANVFEVTNKGNTPLHTACLKGYGDIVEVLLKHVRRDELNDFVNAKTTSSGTAPLHIAAKGDFVEIVKSLLKHGATYEIKNKEGEMPIELSENQNITNLLRLIEELFRDITNGDSTSINKLREVERDEFLAITSARNDQGNTILQVAVGNKQITDKLLKMMKNLDQVKSQFSYELEATGFLAAVRSYAEYHIRLSSETYLPTLRHLSVPDGSEENSNPWKTLREGSYYLRNAHNVVQTYNNYLPGSIDYTQVQPISNFLLSLGFDSNHISSGYTEEAYGGKAKCFVSKGHGKIYYQQLHSKFKEDVRSFIEMASCDVDIRIIRILESIEERLQSPFSENLLEAIKNNNSSEVEKYIAGSGNVRLKDWAIVNFKDPEGRTPLHHAIGNRNLSIVCTLLSNGAEITHVTNKGNNSLHIASFKDYKDIVDLLLQQISHDKLNDFVNAKTTSSGTTSLHIAAKGGSLGIVKSLLKHGAIYEIKNKKGKTPLDLSKDQKITNLLKLIQEAFRDINNFNAEAVRKLRGVNPDEFIAITNARNKQGNTLLQVAVDNKYENIAGELLTLMKEPPVKPQCNDELELIHFQNLHNVRWYAERHCNLSAVYLEILRGMSEPDGSEKNLDRWKTLKEGSYYLGNAYDIVHEYKDYVPRSIDYNSLRSLRNLMESLEFDREHISSGFTEEAYGGMVNCFVSKGQGKKYYEMLHSEFKKDVRSFVEMAERDIDTKVKRILDSIRKCWDNTLPKKLFDAIENDRPLVVEGYIKLGAEVNFKDPEGRTPLLHAVSNGNLGVVKVLLNNGAEITQVNNKGNTSLHIASIKNYKQIVELLLQHIRSDRLNDFVNAKIISSGTTSLHIAAKGGSLEVVKSLLKHGANYEIKDKKGKMPIDLSTNQKVTKLLKLIQELSKDFTNGNPEAIDILRKVNSDELWAFTSTRNNQGNTLLQAVRANGHNIADILFQLMTDKVQSQFDPEWDLDQVEKLKRVRFYAGWHIHFSESHLSILRTLSQQNDSEKNLSPWTTLKEGSYYLRNVHNLIRACTHCIGLIDNKSMQTINDTLATLQFDPEHITLGFTNEAYGGRVKCFVCKGQGTKYHEILHSELKEDIRSFIELTELNIDVPVKKILQSVEQRLKTEMN